MKLTKHRLLHPLRPYCVVWDEAYTKAAPVDRGDSGVAFVLKLKVHEFLHNLPTVGWWKFKWRAVSYVTFNRQPFTFYSVKGKVRIGYTPKMWFARRSDILAMKLILGNDLDD